MVKEYRKSLDYASYNDREELDNEKLLNEKQSAAEPVILTSIIPSHDNGKKKSIFRRLKRVAKITLPHLLLTLLMLTYVFAGSWIFNKLEAQHDIDIATEKAIKIARQYESIHKTSISVCEKDFSRTAKGRKWKKKLYEMLGQLSQVHENRPYEFDAENSQNLQHIIRPKWSFMDGCLYALSILTTTGYTNATPLTSAGQLITVLYGLIGIPLMVLTAVDIGRFLSDIVMYFYTKWAKLGHRILRFFGCIASTARRKLSKKDVHHDNISKETSKSKMKQGVGKKPKTKLPLWATITILLSFNTLGAFWYMAQSDPGMSFFEAFFVCFNLVANLTMGEIPVVRDIFMFLYIAFFVIFGLAVLSMCADLASSDLKWLFTYIHYFGRRMRQTRKLLADVSKYCDNAEEVRELILIIESIRRKFPSKPKITHQDILDFMQTDDEFQQRRLLRLESKKKVFQAKRRDTIAFMPEEMEILKFADEEENAAEQARLGMIGLNPGATNKPFEPAAFSGADSDTLHSPENDDDINRV